MEVRGPVLAPLETAGVWRVRVLSPPMATCPLLSGPAEAAGRTCPAAPLPLGTFAEHTPAVLAPKLIPSLTHRRELPFRRSISSTLSGICTLSSRARGCSGCWGSHRCPIPGRKPGCGQVLGGHLGTSRAEGPNLGQVLREADHEYRAHVSTRQEGTVHLDQGCAEGR